MLNFDEYLSTLVIGQTLRIQQLQNAIRDSTVIDDRLSCELERATSTLVMLSQAVTEMNHAETTEITSESLGVLIRKFQLEGNLNNASTEEA